MRSAKCNFAFADGHLPLHIMPLVDGARALQHDLRLEWRARTHIPGGVHMTNSAGPEGPPEAWVWSQYRGVAPEGARAVDHDPPPPAAAVAAPVAASSVEHSSLIGLGIAAAVVVIAGLTWLFTTGTASSPSGGETPPAATGTETAPQKSEAAPPAAEPATTTVPAPAAAAVPAEEAKPATPAPAPAKRHKKHKHEG
jgi:prepilin-type processing-associated H-X9-DG protein